MTTLRSAGVAILVFVALAGVAFLYPRPTVEARAIRACKEGPENFASVCYTKLIEQTLKERGLGAALTVVAAVSATDADFGRYCHSNMHDLGAAAYKTYRESGNIAISPELSYCGYGFYHGFMEAMFAQTGTLDGAHAFCDALGSKLANPAVAVSNCYHGIGHGITDGDDPRTYHNADAIVAPGLALCAQIAPDNELHRSCALGVFNSVELMYEDPASKLVRTNGPFSLCREGFSDLEKDACYLEMSVLSVSLFHGGAAQVFDSTKQVDAKYLSHTVKYVSLFLAGQKNVPEEILSTCRAHVANYANDCIDGIAQGLLKYGAPGHEYDLAIAFCAGPELTPDEKQRCLSIIVATDTYTPAERKAACAHLPTDIRPTMCTHV